MSYSQFITTLNIVKICKILVAILVISFVWQHFNVQASEKSYIKQTKIIKHKINKPTPEDPYQKAAFLDVVSTKNVIEYSDTDLFCMAKNIYHESRGEPKLGKYAVAQVTINRVKDPRFRNTVCGVVFQPYQFSWANNKKIRWTKPTGPSWKESMHIATAVLKNGATVKGMEKTLYFHANYVRPNWRNVRKVAKIGAHIFYNKT